MSEDCRIGERAETVPESSSHRRRGFRRSTERPIGTENSPGRPFSNDLGHCPLEGRKEGGVVAREGEHSHGAAAGTASRSEGCPWRPPGGDDGVGVP